MKLKKALKLGISTVKKKRLKGLKELSVAYLNLLREPQIMPNQPIFVQIEPTLHCNLRCSMCMNPTTSRERRHMSLYEFKRILQEIPPLSKISLVGAGEPLLNPEIFEMIKCAKSRRILVGFATNGMLLNDENCRMIADSMPDWINISVDSAHKEKYESIRDGADFEVLTENIKRLLNLNHNRGSFEISIWFVLMNDNFRELPSVIQYSKRIGVKKVCCQMQHSWGMPNSKEFTPDEARDIHAVLRGAAQLAKKEGVLFDYVNIPDSHTKRACKWPWKACYVTAEGFITPCCLQGSNPEIINFGNILNTAFDDIWNNQSYQDFRKRLKSSTPPGICRDCTAYFKKIKI